MMRPVKKKSPAFPQFIIMISDTQERLPNFDQIQECKDWSVQDSTT